MKRGHIDINAKGITSRAVQILGVGNIPLVDAHGKSLNSHSLLTHEGTEHSHLGSFKWF